MAIASMVRLKHADDVMKYTFLGKQEMVEISKVAICSYMLMS